MTQTQKTLDRFVDTTNPCFSMNLVQALHEEHSKERTMEIVEWIGNSEKRFAKLLEIIKGNDAVLAQRAAWVIGHSAELYPEAVQPHIPELLQFLETENLHDAIKRNTMKAASILDLPKRIGGLVADIAFAFLSSPNEAIAPRAYSLTVLARLCQDEPELVPEFRLAMEHMSRHTLAPALRVRMRQAREVIDQVEEK